MDETTVMKDEICLECDEITFDDKKQFSILQKQYPPRTSELTFTNLYSWRQPNFHQVCRFKDHLLVSYVKDKRRFYQPIGPSPHLIIKEVLKICPDTSFERVESSVAAKLKGDFVLEPQREHFDYVYKVADLIELPGQDFAVKRNFVKRASKLSPIVEEISETNIQECIQVQKRWLKFRNHFGDKTLISEDIAVRTALEQFKELGIFGIAIRVKGDIHAFALGEELNPETIVEHFEKADSDITGIYQFLLNEFAKTFPNYKYLNREQDLGIPGIMKAKMSYKPDHLVEKFRITIK